MVTIFLQQQNVLVIGTDWFVLLPLLFGSVFLFVFRLSAQAGQAYSIYSLSLWADKFIYLIFVLFLYFSGLLESESVLLAASLSMLLISVIGILFFFHKHVDFSIRSFSKSEFFDVSLPTLIATIALYFSTAAFVILCVGSWYGAEHAAWFSVAFVIAGMVTVPISWITPKLLPRFTLDVEAGESNRLSGFFSTTLDPLIKIYGVIVMIILLLSPLIVYIIGKDFEPAIPVISIIISATVADVVHLLTVPMLYAKSLNRAVVISAAARSSVFIIFGLFIMNNSLDGLAISYLFAIWASAWVSLISLGAIVPKRFLVSVTVVMLLSSLPSILIVTNFTDILNYVLVASLIALSWQFISCLKQLANLKLIDPKILAALSAVGIRFSPRELESVNEK